MTQSPIMPVPKYVIVRHFYLDKRTKPKFVIAERAIGYSPYDPTFTPIAEFRVEAIARRLCLLMNNDFAQRYVTGSEE